MGSVLYNFLSDSFLLRDQEIESEFGGHSDNEIKAELSKYRDFCLNSMPTISEEIEQTPSSVRVFSGSESVPISRLKETSLYIEQYVLADPLLNLTLEKSGNQRLLGASMGFNSEDSLDRKQLVEAARYLKVITPMVVADYVKFFPLSYFFEPPETIPMNASDTYFSDVLPETLMTWFQSKAKTVSMRKVEEGWAMEDRLYPCRAINVSFADLDSSWEYASQYYLQEMQPDPSSFNSETGEFRGRLVMPDTAPEIEYFKAWVFQSENQSARKVFDKVSFQASVAAKYNALYLAEDKLVFELLQQELGGSESIGSHTASTVMKLELPFLERVSVEDLMRIRLEDGEVFKAFRLALEKQFRELRLVHDENDLKVRTQNALHELMEVQVYDVERRIKTIKRQSFAAGTIATGGLLGAVLTGGWSLLATAAVAVGGYKSYEEYRSKVKENPAFFMWKVMKNANRRKGLRKGPGRRY